MILDNLAKTQITGGKKPRIFFSHSSNMAVEIDVSSSAGPLL